ncbi:SPFH domain-containing protein, partial [Escherichia coli]|uniref:SPFH domain-containing protein n=4 Tax=Enterobacteriaceae TaxID=543 RepID=UPI00192A3961
QDLEGQLRGLMLQHISDAVASSGTPFLDLAANQVEFAAALQGATAPAFAALGLELLSVTMQSVSLPEELQKILDQRIGMGIIGQNMGQFMQYQAAQALPEMAKGVGAGGSGIAGEAVGLGAGVALGQTLAQTLGQGLAGVGAAAPAPAASKPDDIV